jgi:hypothetical protein
VIPTGIPPPPPPTPPARHSVAGRITLTLDDAQCVEKTYPEFWDHCAAAMGLRVAGVAVPPTIAPPSPGGAALRRLRRGSDDGTPSATPVAAAAGAAAGTSSSLVDAAAPAVARPLARRPAAPTAAEVAAAVSAFAPFTVVLIGMRGAGKTSLAQRAAATLASRLAPLARRLANHGPPAGDGAAAAALHAPLVAHVDLDRALEASFAAEMRVSCRRRAGGGGRAGGRRGRIMCSLARCCRHRLRAGTGA